MVQKKKKQETPQAKDSKTRNLQTPTNRNQTTPSSANNNILRDRLISQVSKEVETFISTLPSPKNLKLLGCLFGMVRYSNDSSDNDSDDDSDDDTLDKRDEQFIELAGSIIVEVAMLLSDETISPTQTLQFVPLLAQLALNTPIEDLRELAQTNLSQIFHKNEPAAFCQQNKLDLLLKSSIKIWPGNIFPSTEGVQLIIDLMAARPSRDAISSEFSGSVDFRKAHLNLALREDLCTQLDVTDHIHLLPVSLCLSIILPVRNNEVLEKSNFFIRSFAYGLEQLPKIGRHSELGSLSEAMSRCFHVREEWVLLDKLVSHIFRNEVHTKIISNLKLYRSAELSAKPQKAVEGMLALLQSLLDWWKRSIVNKSYSNKQKFFSALKEHINGLYDAGLHTLISELPLHETLITNKTIKLDKALKDLIDSVPKLILEVKGMVDKQ